jgi:hypothetical protein
MDVIFIIFLLIIIYFLNLTLLIYLAGDYSGVVLYYGYYPLLCISIFFCYYASWYDFG